MYGELAPLASLTVFCVSVEGIGDEGNVEGCLEGELAISLYFVFSSLFGFISVI